MASIYLGIGLLYGFNCHFWESDGIERSVETHKWRTLGWLLSRSAHNQRRVRSPGRELISSLDGLLIVSRVSVALITIVEFKELGGVGRNGRETEQILWGLGWTGIGLNSGRSPFPRLSVHGNDGTRCAMIRLGLLRRRDISCTGDRFVTIVGVPAISLLDSSIAVFVFLLLTFGTGPFGLPVTAIVKAFSMPPLPFGCFLGVKISRETVYAEMLIWDLAIIVETQYMLPGVALGAVDCATIVIGIATDAFDGILLLVSRVGI